MVDEKTKDVEIMVSIDTLPNWIRMGQVKIAEDFLKKKFEESLPDKIERYGKLPYLLIQLREFNSLIQEVRTLYVNGYYRAAVALCGMTAEAICIAIANERVKNKSLKKHLVDPSKNCRKKIRLLKDFFKNAKSTSWLHQVLDTRMEHIHLHKTRVIPEEILKCINKLHLAERTML